MPAVDRRQSNAMLYTLVAFVGLFIIATTVAVIFYVKAEDYRTRAESAVSTLEEYANSAEQRKIGTTVGAKPRRKSWLGTMTGYLDAMVYLIIGGPVEDTSAEVKVGKANRKVSETMQLLQKHIDIQAIDPNATGLVRVIERLNAELNDAKDAAQARKQEYDKLQEKFDDAMAQTHDKEQELLAEKDNLQQQVDQIKQAYDELRELMKQTTTQQVQNLQDQLNEEKDRSKNLQQKLLDTQAELKVAKDRMREALEKLAGIKPEVPVDIRVNEPDGKILLVDAATKTVHLNLGSDDKVYPGLTFSVYDKSVPIPKDGKGKAEVEVFNVGKNISAARIIRSEIRRPILVEDLVANLVWDSSKTNVFVVAGEFDVDYDGYLDPHAVDKIKTLIEKWGGKTTDTISINTDFVVLGSEPVVPQRPTIEEMQMYPTAMQKFEQAVQKRKHYVEVENQAKSLSIPIFDYDRFLYLIGYKTQATEPGAFTKGAP